MPVTSIQRNNGLAKLPPTDTVNEATIGVDTADNKVKINNSSVIQKLVDDAQARGNFSTAQVAGGYASDTYLAGSSITIPPNGWQAGGRYTCMFDMVKTGAGTAAFTINLRLGNAGSTSDASLISFAFTVGTANADTGTFVVTAHFRTVGSGTSAVVVGSAECRHALAATGLTTLGASGQAQITSASSGFDSTTANGVLGLSVNGGASFSGTNTIVQAEYKAY